MYDPALLLMRGVISLRLSKKATNQCKLPPVHYLLIFIDHHGVAGLE
jgi:hypothetical protein